MTASGRESNHIIINGKYAAVRDSNLMGIPAKISDSIAEGVKNLFYVGVPVNIIEGMVKLILVIRISEVFTGREKESYPLR